MATTKAKSRVKPLASMPEGRALRFTDITSKGQTSLNQQMLPMGQAKSRRTQAVARQNRILRNPEAGEKAKTKAAQRKGTSAAMHAAGAFTDVPTTHEGASQRRVDLAEAGIARGQREGHMGVASGEDWYFTHHAKLAKVAAETGHAKDRVIAASASMSPQNNPDQELEAVSALAHAHADRKARIRVTPEAAEILRPDMPNVDDYVGRDVHPKRFSPSDLAAVSSPDVREHVETKGNVDLNAMAKGGVRGNVTKAIDVLRGNIKPEEAIDPHSSPKVWSYHESIKHSVPGTPEHEEFMSRMDVAMRRPNQTRLDLFGLAGSSKGILSSSHPTAEDTWMQAISTGQQLKTVAIPGRSGKANQQSPAKFTVGEGGTALDKQLKAGSVVQGAPGPSAVMHAWQSHATETAARSLGERSGEIVPSVGVQALSWTEARREAGGGKDAPYEGRVASFHAARSPSYAMPQPMFTPSGQVTEAARPLAQHRLALGGAIRLASEQPKAPKKSRKQAFGGPKPESLF